MFQRGDIVAVNFPFTDLTGSKLRPAIVMSNSNRITSTGDVIIVKITSVFRNDGLNLEIEPNDLNFTLPKESYVRCHCITAIDESIIKKKIGNATAEFTEKGKGKILHIISGGETPEEKLLKAIFKE